MPDREDRQMWEAFTSVLVWLPAALDDQLERDAALTLFEYGILWTLSEADERTLRMSELARATNASLSKLSRAAARLERRGWMTRLPDPADGRCTLAVLTDAGRDKAADATPGHIDAVNRLVFDQLTAPQVRQLHEISDRILRAVRTEDSRPPQR
ncbi:DNA-binding MarR family transcriptional regulator [Catenulispora sp. EB89]|uniref:MarR family winged helix-turn-helix transcriptional regulator n=1 Tax=Catenulispora sp. EB89 TaxID=3156257 RepID=UPI00351698D2